MCTLKGVICLIKILFIIAPFTVYNSLEQYCTVYLSDCMGCIEDHSNHIFRNIVTTPITFSEILCLLYCLHIY
jgi:hypothetical protein